MTPEEKKRRHRNERIAATIFCVAVAIAVVAFVLWNRAENRKFEKERSYIPKPVTMTPELALLQDYLRIDTSNPPGHERPAAEWLANLLRQNGVASEVIESAPGRANLYARIRGKQRGGGLLLMHHMDVVPANPQEWTHPPFAAKIVLGQLYGRGALDMKSMGICELLAFLDIARSGRVPEHDLVLLAVADEETGGTLGTQWLLEHRPDVFADVQYVLNEGGINEVQAERVTYFGIEIGTKITVSLDVLAPTLEQARRTRIALEPSFIAYKAERVRPEVRRFLKELAPTRMQYRKQLEDVDGAISRGNFWNLPRGYRELTYNVVWCDGAQAAPEGGFRLPCFLVNLPDEDPDGRIRWLEEKVRPYGARLGQIRQKDVPTPISPADTPLFAILADEARRQYGSAVGTEILHRELNDSRFLRRRGMICYGIFPYPVDIYSSVAIHEPNERLRAEWFEQGVSLLRRIVRRYCLGGE